MSGVAPVQPEDPELVGEGTRIPVMPPSSSPAKVKNAADSLPATRATAPPTRG